MVMMYRRLREGKRERESGVEGGKEGEGELWYGEMRTVEDWSKERGRKEKVCYFGEIWTLRN